MSRIFTLVWQSHPGYTILLALMVLIQGCIPAAQLWITKLLIDSIALLIQDGSAILLRHVIFLVGLQAVIYLAGHLLNLGREVISTLLGELLRINISLKVIDKTNKLEYACFEDPVFYNKLYNAFLEAGSRPLDIVMQFFSLGQAVIALFSILFILLQLHWGIIILIIVTMIPLLLVQNKFGYDYYWMMRERAPDLRKQEYINMLMISDWLIKEIRLFKLEDFLKNLYKLFFKRFYSENRKLIIKRNVQIGIVTIFSGIGWFAAAIYVAYSAFKKKITIGDFALYIQAISTLQNQINAIMTSISSVYKNSLYIGNLFEFMKMPENLALTGKEWTEPVEEIEFKDVSFKYPGTDYEVLHHISFSIRKGQAIALVGKNGSGKTTIVKLLCRLFEPTSGAILINGKSIAEYNPHSLQEQIAVLFQDFGQYFFTAAENINVGRIHKENSFESIREAARKSGADEFISKLPKKYESMLGKWFEEGNQLSGGEWQKIALARAFLRQGAVLILDEPTASLDAEAEFEIFESLLKEKNERITLLISHRFSTVRLADNILVLEDGKCIENDTHDELMVKNGKYARLFKIQAKGYAYV